MARQISTSRLFRVTTEVSDDLLKAMKSAPDLARAAIMDGAKNWHDDILDKQHFIRSAHDRYDYAKRSLKYIKRKKGLPDLYFTGGLKSDLNRNAIYIPASNVGVSVRMYARVFNLIKGNMPEKNPDKYIMVGPRKTSRGKTRKAYPNLKREIHRFDEADRQETADVVHASLDKEFNAVKNGTAAKTP